MSAVRVVQWSVNSPDREACEQAVEAVAEHVRLVHPATQGFRTYCQSFGPLRRWTYFAVFECESVTGWDNDPEAPCCEALWAPIYRIAQGGSFAMSFWSDSQRESTPDAPLFAGSPEESGGVRDSRR